MLRRTGGTCGRFRFGSVEGNATSQTGARQTCSRANRKNAAVLSSQDWVGAVSSRAWKSEREREDAMSCVVWEGLFSARGAASQPGDVRHGAVGGGGGGETRRVCRDSGVSLSALQAARRSVTLQWARRRGVVCQRRHKTSRKRQRGMCEIPRRGGSLCWSLKEIILEEKGGRADDRKVDREVFGGGGKPDIASASAIVEARDGLGAPA